MWFAAVVLGLGAPVVASWRGCSPGTEAAMAPVLESATPPRTATPS
jgi:hypothetical protein